MVKIAIQGVNGRMGRVLAGLVSARDDCVVAAGIDISPAVDAAFPVYAQLADVKEDVDVLVDFSLPAATRAALAECGRRGLPCVVCTTGLSEDDKALLAKTAERAAVFYSANMSLGVNVLTELVKRAAAVLPGFDIEIVERHHHNKLDAPSGTALALADAANAARGGQMEYVYDRHAVKQKRGADELGISAVRGGSIVGEHDVIFAGPDEVLTLSHTAYSRDIFANGAIAAALYVAGKPAGLYNMAGLVNSR